MKWLEKKPITKGVLVIGAALVLDKFIESLWTDGGVLPVLFCLILATIIAYVAIDV